jgi:hypothetical protein
MLTPTHFDERGAENLPGLLGTAITPADTSAGYRCMANLPEGAAGLTTIDCTVDGRPGAGSGRAP